MFRKVKTQCAAILLYLVLALTPTVQAAPKDAVIYPDSAQVLEETSVKTTPAGVRLARAEIVVPPQADPDTLVVRLPAAFKLRLADLKWKRITPGETPEVASVKKELDGLLAEKAKLDATIQSQKARIEFWQAQTKTHTKKVAEAAEIAAALGDHIQRLLRDKYPNDKKMEELDKRIKATKDKLQRLTGGADSPWLVELLVSGAAPAELSLTYSYTLNGCGWSSVYRLDAIPGENRVGFVWEAEIRQSSGSDWTNVDVSLATLRRTWAIAPADLPPWIIQPRIEQKKNLKAARAAGAAPLMAEVMSAPAPVSDAVEPPQAESRASFMVWKLGKRTIPAGVNQRVALQDESWPAAFTHLIRPGIDGRAFVRAKATLPESREIPHGLAMFMIDGALLGKRDFSVSGQDAEIFFGSDPLITAKVRNLTSQSGSAGVFGGKRTQVWEWEIEIKNAKTYPVSVLVEEPRPEPRDERISLKADLSPQPTEIKDNRYVWTLDIPAGAEKRISEKISLEAPKDMNLDLGWRR